MNGPYRVRNNDSDTYDPDNFIFGESFGETAIRNKFVQRVYTILAVQLLYTCCFIALSIYELRVKKFILTNTVLLFSALGVEMGVYFCLVCCISMRRKFPANFILLAIFTVAFAYIMAAISAIYATFIVMSSMGITALVCTIVSVFACITSMDITSWGIYLCVISIIVLIFGIVAVIVVFVTGSRIMFIIYAGIIAILFSIYLMYDTQMIMGGRRIELSPEEYIFGALTLYVDIMQIFWAILTILGYLRK